MRDRDRISVLIVEDDRVTLMETADALAGAGLAVFTARDADEAIVLLAGRTDIRVLVGDLHMPTGTLSGHDLLRTVRLRWPDLGLLVLSGRPRPLPNELPDGVRFIPKPIRDRELIGAVFALAERQSAGSSWGLP